MAQVFAMEQVSFRYGDEALFSGASVSVAEGEKVGIVGPNGAGKSTLLKLITGEEAPDLGAVNLKNGLRIASLRQSPRLDPALTLETQALAFAGMAGDEKAYEARSLLTRLGFTDLTQRCGTLSGGQQKRVALCGALLKDAELLLLDEPTNHLDTGMIQWLEDYLLKYRGTLLMVTHDRYFLDRVCGRILEVSGGGIESYSANYQGYLIQKAERESMAEASLRKKQSLYKKELEWIQRGARARSTKAKGRVERFQTLEEAVKPDAAAQTLKLASVSSRLGKKILSCEHVYKALGGKELIRDFTYLFLRDDRIGIIGENGAGKTTLLNLLDGTLLVDQGVIERGETVRIGYFRQHFPEMDGDMKLIDAARNVAVRVHTPDGDLTAGQMLERFLFPASMHSVQVARLSGGEKRRLYLLQVLLTAPNLLLLDEPTNDLDIDTLTVLEDYLDSFQGAVITVTHDRYFLDRVTRRLFALEDGVLNPYEGGFSEYLAMQAEKEEPPASKPDKPKAQREAARREKKEFSFKERRDYQTIENDIAAYEEELAQISRDIEENSSDYVKVSELMEKQSQVEEALYAAMDRFVYLQDLLESFKKEP